MSRSNMNMNVEHLSNNSNIRRGAPVEILSGNWNVYHDIFRDYKRKFSSRR